MWMYACPTCTSLWTDRSDLDEGYTPCCGQTTTDLPFDKELFDRYGPHARGHQGPTGGKNWVGETR